MRDMKVCAQAQNVLLITYCVQIPQDFLCMPEISATFVRDRPEFITNGRGGIKIGTKF